MPHTASYTTILNELNRDVARAKPADPLQFCANWFNAKLEEQRKSHLTGSTSMNTSNTMIGVGPSDLDGPTAPGMASPTQRASLFSSDPFSASVPAAPLSSGPFGSSDPFASSSSAEPEALSSAAEHVIPSTFNLGRRTSVSAESMAPSEATADTNGTPLPKTVIHKSEEQMQRIRGSIGNNLLFRNLEQDQYRDVLLAMKEVKVDSGNAVIEQGAQGDYFYVVESGTLDVYIRSRSTATSEAPSGSSTASLGDKKVSYGPGSSFGELALLYAQPRAATVLSTSACTLWALDRITFRSILMETNSRRRALYEKFLMDVPLFERLSSSERAKISDSLELREYSAGEAVIVQGERGTEFFIIVQGNAQVRKTKQAGREEVVGKLSRGDYFGELALLNNAPRAATVVAVHSQEEQQDGTPVIQKLRVVSMSERAFTRLLGPLAGILERHAQQTYGEDYSSTTGPAAAATSAPMMEDAPSSFPHPMDPSAKPGAGAWSAPNPFAATT